MGLAATTFLLGATASCALAAVAAVALPSLWPAVLGLDAVVILTALCDFAWALRRLRAVRVTATGARIWSRDRPETVRYTVDLPDKAALRVRLLPDMPGSMKAVPADICATLPGRRCAELTFQLSGSVRGTFVLGGLHLELVSPLGLWHIARRLGEPMTVHVHPDLRQINDYTLMARAGRLDLIGVRRARRSGGDTEFERLRDHHGDDPLNRIDWKATARRDHLTVRDYQVSQCQSLTLLVDAGRLMAARVICPHAPSGTRMLLDHAIDAALMLAHVALVQRDRVGLLAYTEGVRRRVPAGAGARTLRLLVHAVHDLAPESTMSRHDEALLALARSERKRSLVVILTHLVDEIGADLLERHCASVSGRHLPLVVLLQDDDLTAAGAADRRFTGDEAGFWLAGAAASVLTWRAGLCERLRTRGCLVMDVAPSQLTAGLVSQYLDIKARNLL